VEEEEEDGDDDGRANSTYDSQLDEHISTQVPLMHEEACLDAKIE
jgi:hypothetical protein